MYCTSIVVLRATKEKRDTSCSAVRGEKVIKEVNVLRYVLVLKCVISSWEMFFFFGFPYVDHPLAYGKSMAYGKGRNIYHK